MTLGKLSLRPYQREAIDALHESWNTHDRVAVVLPTGFGKTVVFSHLISEAHAAGTKVLVIVHREELAEQARQKIVSVSPDIEVGIVKAQRNEVAADVIVGSVQTLARPNRRAAIKNVGMIIVDECHHAAARTWVEVLEHFGAYGREYSPDTLKFSGAATKTVGFTATLTRDDGKGLADVWQTVAFERDIMYGIERGYLCDVSARQVTVDGFDLATIARTRGDYSEGALGDAMESSGAGEVIADAYIEHAGSRPGILFAPTVSSAYSFAEDMNAKGIVTEVVIGETPAEERALMYKRFAHGETQVLANCMVLTEGFDAPHAAVAVIARPTSSAALYTQMVGRVLRPYPGKDEALVLDVVGISGRHKLRSLTDLSHTEVRDGETLREARARIDDELAEFERERGERQKVAGERAHKIVDMFESSHSVWLRTNGGMWFIPFKGGQVVLWEAPDATWQVGVKRERIAGEWLGRGMTFEYAMAHGESIAAGIDPSVSSKSSSWRRAKPSEAQLGLALRLKLAPADELTAMRKGALSDLLSIYFASKALDPKPARQLRH